MMQEVDTQSVETHEPEKQNEDKRDTDEPKPKSESSTVPDVDDEEDDYEDEDEDEDDDSKHYESNPLLSMEFIDGSESNVIIIDGEPKCYTKDTDSANKIMWDIARYYKYLYNDYNTYIRECDTPMHIQLVGSRKFWAVSYDKVLLNISTSVIRGVEDVAMEASEMVEPTTTTPTDDSTLVSRFFG